MRVPQRRGETLRDFRAGRIPPEERERMEPACRQRLLGPLQAGVREIAHQILVGSIGRLPNEET